MGILNKNQHDDTIAPLPLIPMIDIIFMLLLFFMMGSHFKVSPMKIDTFLPAVTKTVADPNQPPPPEYKITIEPAGTGNHGAFFYIGSVRFARIEALIAQLQQIQKLPGEKSIVVDSLSGVEFRHVMGVLDACLSVGLDKISFARPAM